MVDLIPAKVMVDLENCGFPADTPLPTCIDNIRMTLLHLGFTMQSITAFTCKDEYNPSIKEAHDGLEVVWVKPDPKDEDRDHADLCMKEVMLSFALRHQGPAALLIITCDRDYLSVMNLVKESGITLMHAYTKASTTQNLIDVTAQPMIWHYLVKGELFPVDFSAGDFNVPQPPPSPPH